MSDGLRKEFMEEDEFEYHCNDCNCDLREQDIVFNTPKGYCKYCQSYNWVANNIINPTVPE